MTLTKDELARYARHLALPQVGVEGQEKLKAAKVLLVGVGGLGSPVGLYLAAAGVGRIGLVDDDVVDASNLQRQVLYGERDIGRPKLAAAARRLREIDPHVQVDEHATRFTRDNAHGLLRPYDIIVDATDNFPTRYLANDVAVLQRKPNVHASVFRFEGQASVFDATRGPCYRCLLPRPPPPDLVPDCAQGGVLGVLPGLLGAIQATETLKLILGIGTPLLGRLLLVDALSMETTTLILPKDPGCALCGDEPTITELVDYDAFCGARTRSDEGAEGRLTARELERRLRGASPPLLLDVREPWETDLAVLPGATLLPLADLVARMSQLPRDRDIVVYCHKGSRSARAASTLRAAGLARAMDLEGGIDAWSAQVDDAVPRY